MVDADGGCVCVCVCGNMVENMGNMEFSTHGMHVRVCLCCVYLHFHLVFIFHFSDVTVTAIFA